MPVWEKHRIYDNDQKCSFFLKFISFYGFFCAGAGTALDWDFCSSSSPCAYKEGDCDNDGQCVKDFVCGKGNCNDFWSLADAKADCCIPGKWFFIGDLKIMGCVCVRL